MHKGNTYLQACKKLFEYAEINYSFGEEGIKTKSQYKYPNETPINNKERVYSYLGRRGISKDVIDYLDIREDEHGNCVFNFCDLNDVLTMKKFRPARTIDKAKKEPKCWCDTHSDKSPLLFNMNRINTSQALLITEGEIDAASAIEAGFYNTVSIPLGANNFQWLEENFDWLELFDTIIIASDNDSAGEKMRTECIYRLGTWRCKVVEYPKYKELEGGRKIPIEEYHSYL
jgi:twinkle protein